MLRRGVRVSERVRAEPSDEGHTDRFAPWLQLSSSMSSGYMVWDGISSSSLMRQLMAGACRETCNQCRERIVQPSLVQTVSIRDHQCHLQWQQPFPQCAGVTFLL